MSRLTLKEMQIKVTHFSPNTGKYSVSEPVSKQALSYMSCGKANMYDPFGGQLGNI